MNPRLYLDEPWAASDPFLDDDSPTVDRDPCGLLWLPVLAGYVLLGGACAGIVVAFDRLTRRKP